MQIIIRLEKNIELTIGIFIDFVRNLINIVEKSSRNEDSYSTPHNSAITVSLRLLRLRFRITLHFVHPIMVMISLTHITGVSIIITTRLPVIGPGNT